MKNISDELALDDSQWVVTIDHETPDGYRDDDQVIQAVSDLIRRMVARLHVDLFDLPSLTDNGLALLELGQVFNLVSTPNTDLSGNYFVGESAMVIETVEDYLDRCPMSWVIQTPFDSKEFERSPEVCMDRHAQIVGKAIGFDSWTTDMAADVFNDGRVHDWTRAFEPGKVILRTEVMP